MFQLVRLICSFVNSTAELGRLRLVNHLFHHEATSKFQLIHRPILVKTKAQVEDLLYIVNIHKNLELTTFPFSTFNLVLKFNWPRNLDSESIESFVREIGPHIRRLKFQVVHYNSENISVIGDALVNLLCHTPKLSDLEIRLDGAELTLSAQQLLRIPLRFPNLRVLDIDQNWIFPTALDSTQDHLVPVPVPVTDVLINRAVYLKRFRAQIYDFTPDMRVLRLIRKKHGQNMPLLSLNQENSLTICPDTLHVVHELMGMNLQFWNISILLNHRYDNPTTGIPNQGEFQNMMEVVSTWLTTQSNTLTHVKIDYFSALVPFRIPSLPVLNNLHISYSVPWTHSGEPAVQPVNPIIPFAPNQFPMLNSINLQCYKESYEIFGLNPQPNIRRLNLDCLKAPLTNPAWRIVLPNLISLRIGTFEINEEIICSNIAFILTHLSNLVHLELDHSNGSGMFDFWNVWTGGAPRVAKRHLLFNETFDADTNVLVEPVGGIYEVPSLRNMRGRNLIV